jgi:hypothetical protein
MLKPRINNLFAKVTIMFIIFEPTKFANVVMYYYTQETKRDTYFLHHKGKKSLLHHKSTLH